MENTRSQHIRACFLPSITFCPSCAVPQNIRRRTSVRAVSVCDINILTRDALVETLLRFPAVEEVVRSRGRRRLMEMQEMNWRGGADDDARRAGAGAAVAAGGASVGGGLVGRHNTQQPRGAGAKTSGWDSAADGDAARRRR